jgi:hypothetical protein
LGWLTDRQPSCVSQLRIPRRFHIAKGRDWPNYSAEASKLQAQVAGHRYEGSGSGSGSKGSRELVLGDSQKLTASRYCVQGCSKRSKEEDHDEHVSLRLKSRHALDTCPCVEISPTGRRTTVPRWSLPQLGSLKLACASGPAPGFLLTCDQGNDDCPKLQPNPILIFSFRPKYPSDSLCIDVS